MGTVNRCIADTVSRQIGEWLKKDGADENLQGK